MTAPTDRTLPGEGAGCYGQDVNSTLESPGEEVDRVDLDEQRATALAITDPALRFKALEALKERLTQQLDDDIAQTIRAGALAEGPRNMGPAEDREYNWEAFGRKIGLSGFWTKRRAKVDEPAPV